MADDNIVAKTQPDTAPTPPDISSLPLWQRSIIKYLQLNLPLQEAARLVNNTSMASIEKHLQLNPLFAQAVALAEAGVTVFDEKHAQLDARGRVGAVIDRWSHIMMHSRSDRDAINAGRQIAEAAGIVGGGNTINVGVRVDNQPQPWNMYQQHLTNAVEGAKVKPDEKAPSDSKDASS